MLLKTFLLAIQIQGVSAQSIYSLDDLVALESEKNFNEFLEHVNDIRPSERQAKWKSMYRNMILEMIDFKNQTKAFDEASFKNIEKHARLKTFITDEVLQLKRNGFAIKYLTQCYQEKATDCDSKLDSFWIFSNGDIDTGIELGLLVDKYQKNGNSWNYYKQAISSSQNAFYCNRPNIQSAIFKQLSTEALKPNFNKNFKALISKEVSSDCFNKITPLLRNVIRTTHSSGIEKELAFNLLSATGKLEAYEEDLYAVTYLSDGPVVGDKLNLAWKRVENLGRNYKQRAKILEEIKKFEAIPDYTFKNAKNPRHKAIINLLAQNFPEFLNYYGENCIKYIGLKSGPGSVVKNSQCRELLELAIEVKGQENIQWLSDSIQSQYSGLKK